MQLKDIMTSQVEVVQPETTLQIAAQKMLQFDVGPLPVCEGEHLVGMITDRDITTRAVAEGCDPKTTPVRQAMTPDILYCFEDQDVEDAAKIMERHQIRRLPILNREKRLVGIVSLGDLALNTADQQRVGEVLEQVSEPTA